MHVKPQQTLKIMSEYKNNNKNMDVCQYDQCCAFNPGLNSTFVRLVSAKAAGVSVSCLCG